jgi:RNA polymerase sigma-70 factor, ECF subfamily
MSEADVKHPPALTGHDAWTDSLAPALYGELRRLAHHYLRQERPSHTLQATALVHEVYLRLAPQHGLAWEDRGKFVGIAAHLMRRVLVDYARTRHREKRGGKGLQRVPLTDDAAVLDPADSDRWTALDEALVRLSELSPRQAQVVELRYFGGLTVEEAASVLEISPKTIKRDWAIARAWLRRELSGATQATHG